MEELGSELHYVCTINEANMGIQVAAIAERYKAADDGADAGSTDSAKERRHARTVRCRSASILRK